jgi:hypothetical protein
VAELYVSAEEEHCNSFLLWDDESLGRFTKFVALALKDMRETDKDGTERTAVASAAAILVTSCIDNKSNKLTLELDGFEMDGKPVGDWTVTVQRKLQA